MRAVMAGPSSSTSKWEPASDGTPPRRVVPQQNSSEVALQNLEELRRHGFLQEHDYNARRNLILSDPNYISIESLPNELLFTYVFPAMSMLMQLRMLLVSKRWKACAEYAFSCATKLDFSTSFGDFDKIFKPCLLRTKVNTINFTSCYRLDNNSLRFLNSSPSEPLLKDLDFTKCSRITVPGLATLSPTIIQHLQRLVLTNSGVKSLNNLHFPSLEYLGLPNDSKLQSLFFSCQHLKIRTVDLTKAVFSNEFFRNVLQNCPNLENLYLSEAPSTIIEELLNIDKYNLKIKILDISWIGVNDNQLNQLLPKLHHLERIDLGNNNLITDNSLLAISVHCCNLIGLDIEACHRITTTSLNPIVEHTKLKFLNVKNCDYITLDDLRNYKYKKSDLYIKAKIDLMKKLEQ